MIPKKWGGWGLKDVHAFGCALLSRSIWIFFSKCSLWKEVLIDKYIPSGNILDWVRKANKSITGLSNQWKVLTISLPIIQHFLAWKLGNG